MPAATTDPRPAPPTAHQRHEHLFEGARDPVAAPAQILEPAFGHQLAARDDPGVGAQPLDDIEHVRGQEHRRVARAHEPAQELAQAAGRHGVHALEGLVQEQQARPMDERTGQRQLLAHAVRVTRHQLARVLGKLHRRQQLAPAVGGVRARQAVHAADEAQVLLAGQPFEQVQTVGNDADAAFDRDRIADDVVAQHQRAPLRWRQQPGEDVDGGGLARAVGAEEPEERAFGHAQRQRIDGDLIAEATGQPLGHDGGRGVGHGVEIVRGAPAGRKRQARHRQPRYACRSGGSSNGMSRQRRASSSQGISSAGLRPTIDRTKSCGNM
jgi:hypothetical protein